MTQAGGGIEIYSEVGLGTTITVLLPATDEDVAPYLAPAGTIDEVCAVLNGAEAVRRAGDPAQPITLLLTDVVMPEMMGNEVADRISAIRPDVPALFMSGYAQPILDSHGVAASSYDILAKPFTEAALLTRVRQAITRIPAPRRADPEAGPETGAEMSGGHSAAGQSTARRTDDI